MSLVVAEVPVEPRFEIPLPLLREVLTHEQQFFAGVTHHHGIARFQTAELVELVADKFVYHAALAVHDLVVGKHEHIIFVERVLEGMRHKSVVVGAENRVGVVVLYAVVHPAHVPLQAEAETAVLGGLGHSADYRAVLGNHERVGQLAEHAV